MKNIFNSVRKFLTSIIVFILFVYMVIAAVPAIVLFLIGLFITPNENGVDKKEVSKRLREVTEKIKEVIPDAKVKVTRN